MLGKGAGLLVALAWAIAARAQTVTLRFDGPGDREAWIATAPPEGEPATKVSSKEASLDLPIGPANPKNRLYVLDRKSGLLAILPVPSRTLPVASRSYGYVFRSRVRVEHQGKPVAAALVRVDDGERRQAQFLAPDDKGSVTFYALKLGKIKVEVDFKSGEAKRTTPAQTFDFAADPGHPEPVLTVSIADEVAVVDPEPAAKTAEATESAPAPRSSPPAPILGTIVIMLFGIAAVAGLFWAFFHFARKNPEALKANLEKLGVQVPGGSPSEQEDEPIPAPAGPRPVEPILLGPDAASSIAPLGSVQREPCVVDESGRRFALAEGVNTVGREEGLTISLVGESTVSRRHAEIDRSGADLIVRDLGSTNGTFVNGVRIEDSARLAFGDTVQFGSVRLRVEG